MSIPASVPLQATVPSLRTTATGLPMSKQASKHRGQGPGLAAGGDLGGPGVHAGDGGVHGRLAGGVALELAGHVDALVVVARAGGHVGERLAVLPHDVVGPRDARAHGLSSPERRHERHAVDEAHRHAGTQNSSYTHEISPKSDVTAPTRSSRGKTSTPPCSRKRVGLCMRSSMGTIT